MTRWPELALARWRPGPAATVRDALAALGEVAVETVMRGAADTRSANILVATSVAQPLRRLGLDRAAEAAEALKAWDGTVSAHRTRALLRAMLLARLAEHFPDGPTPRASVEPLVRAARGKHELAMLKGRVLSPLVSGDGEGLAWDVGARALVRLAEPPADERVMLARRVWMDVGHPTPRFTVGRVRPGPPAEACDRRMLRAAIGRFDAVGRALSAELGDPFPRDPTPLLVGPFRFAKRSDEGGLWSVVEDRAGLRAVLMFSGRALEGAAGRGDLYALARPVARLGRLTLLPTLLWVRGRRIPANPPPARGTVWEDGVVHQLHELMMRTVASGLDGAFAVRAQIRALVPHLAAAGFTELARLAGDAVRVNEPCDPVRFTMVAHLTHAVLSGPRWVQLAEAA